MTTRRGLLTVGLLAGLGGLEPVAARASQEAAGNDAPDKDGWRPLWDGATLTGWKKTEFRSGGEFRVEKSFRGGGSAIVLDKGRSLSGFNWTKEVPKNDYEVSLEAMKVEGSDFFCGLTFPVGASHATLILGGWGGGLVGVSSIDDSDASENATTKFMDFAKDKWYKIRLRVTSAKIEAWVDDKPIVDADIAGKKISLRPGDSYLSIPLGVATYQTAAAYRAIRIRSLKK